MKNCAKKHPILLFVGIVIPLSWFVLTLLYLLHLPFELGVLVLNFLGLLATSTLISYWIGGKQGVIDLYSGVKKWRISWKYYFLAVFSIPITSLLLLFITNSLDSSLSLNKFLIHFPTSLITGFLLINLWEETAWMGFMQSKLIHERGEMIGASLTALAFFSVHIPLFLRQNSLEEVMLSLLLVFVLAFFFRYLLGNLFLKTQGSVLLVGLMHASFNSTSSAGGQAVQFATIAATVSLTILVAIYKRWQSK